MPDLYGTQPSEKTTISSRAKKWITFSVISNEKNVQKQEYTVNNVVGLLDVWGMSKRINFPRAVSD